ncbi:MAG: alpha/beta hydrolase-fold protein [Candidatus Sericytochromatia bacterium]|nr:alpha/beta hydrolase-fold protein [Candidatus Sericytochromatia bacterium]
MDRAPFSRLHWAGMVTRRLDSKIRITVDVLAPSTPARARLYLASTLNDWRTDDPAYRFEELEPGRYRLGLDVPRGTTMEYKITRGTWRTVEVDERGQELENRRLAALGTTTVRLDIPHWRDQASARRPARPRSTDVSVVGPLPIPVLGREREVVVYLPPGYHQEPNRRFPVLYMFDGQNLFDPATAFNVEWGVDETCDRLVRSGELAPLIVVGIYNGGEKRLSEQSPWKDARLGADGEGHAFLRWVVGGLKDHIDAHYRTLTGPEHTGVAGSSMGGLTALFAAYRYPLVFGRVAALSPAFWFARSQIFRYIAGMPPPLGARIYLDCGELETARVHPKRDFYRVAHSMVDLLTLQGFKAEDNMRWVSDPRGTHSEACWARRVGPALSWLFPGEGKPKIAPRGTRRLQRPGSV